MYIDRHALISFIRENDPFYSHAILSGYTEEQLNKVYNRIISRQALSHAVKCDICNGTGTVLNIGCIKCMETGTASSI
jgi:hypothetical protein